ncbi:hypothetical protein JKP88DRAFT_328614 [Tribonema minus]|uniref:Uncharacterized protein n=1 Tax=Tribonema minus TaxID=303371 RepID=A0A835YPS0_9STRA|nr:hypothetical protein JKP88DRAFT_328614 [Tribonema minus]
MSVAEGDVRAVLDGLDTVDRVLTNPWQAYSVSAVHKFFVLLDPATKKPLHVFRHTAAGKRYPVQPFQAYSQVVTHLLQPTGALQVTSEWPDGHVITGQASADSSASIGSSSSSARGSSQGRRGKGGAWGGGPTARVFSLNFFVSARSGSTKRRGNKWIGIGPSPPPEYGCKESYTYVAREGGQDGEPDTGLMTYHRYGECPSWYAPGKMCSLDMQARRVESFSALPKPLQSAVRKLVPSFCNVPHTAQEFRQTSGQVATTAKARPLGDPWWQVWKRI